VRPAGPNGPAGHRALLHRTAVIRATACGVPIAAAAVLGGRQRRGRQESDQSERGDEPGVSHGMSLHRRRGQQRCQTRAAIFSNTLPPFPPFCLLEVSYAARPMDLLNGRIAVVTGDSNGIGRMSRVLVREVKPSPFSWPTHS
jgi:hypothetical protein